MDRVEVRLTRLAHAADLPLPAYQSALAAGLDLLAAVPADAPVSLAPGGRAMIPTGIAIALPPGTEAQVRPRSGLAMRHGITVLNSPGTVDADYRGEIQVILVNLGQQSFVVERGMRIAQLVIAAIMQAEIREVANLDETPRGVGVAAGSSMTGTSESTRTTAISSIILPTFGSMSDTGRPDFPQRVNVRMQGITGRLISATLSPNAVPSINLPANFWSLGSNVSRWLTPPHMKRKITDLALGSKSGLK